MSEAPKTEQPQSTEVSHHYLKGQHFRTIYVDGIFGGAGIPTGTIQFAVYTERIPYPDKTIQIDGKEDFSKRIAKRGVERELEVSLVVRLEIAIALRDWLNEKIGVVEKNVEQFVREAAKHLK